jgi:GAF domain-containing protein
MTRASCQREPIAAIVRRLLGEAAIAVGATGVTFWVLSDDGQQMVGALSTGPASNMLESASVPVNESVIGTVATNGLATSIGPADFHNPSIDELTGLHTRAMVAAPVLLRGKIIGVISAINPSGGGLFSASDLEAMSWKAFLIGLVLENASPAPRGQTP